MKRIFWEHLSVLLVLLGFAAAQGEPAAKDRGLLVSANNRAAVHLLKAAALKAGTKEEQDRNFLIPALSSSSVLWMLSNGASTEAQAELEPVFGQMGLGNTQVNKAFAELQDAISKPRSEMIWPPPPPGRPSTRLVPREYVPAVALWAGPNDFTREFLQSCAHYYHAEQFPLRRTKARAAADEVNAWFTKFFGTPHGEVVTTEDVENKDFAKFLITTVTKFRGRWLAEFDVKKTKTQPFHLANGSTRDLPFMERFDPDYAYVEGEQFQSIRLPYRYSEMLIFLPAESSSLRELIKEVTPEKLAAWSKALEHTKRAGTLQLPRFRVESTVDLGTTLQDLGVLKLFHSFSSLRPAIGPPGGHLTTVRQVSMINVNEKETVVETTGVVGGVIGGICGNCPPPPPPFKMVVNRPFLFVIRDTSTKAILYIAAVNDPQEGKAP